MTLPEPWFVLSGPHLDGIQAEYDREITPPHPLYGRGGRVFGKSDASDDVLVSFADGRCAIVHLTWVGEERLPHLFPGFRSFDDGDGLAAYLVEASRRDG